MDDIDGLLEKTVTHVDTAEGGGGQCGGATVEVAGLTFVYQNTALHCC